MLHAVPVEGNSILNLVFAEDAQVIHQLFVVVAALIKVANNIVYFPSEAIAI